MKQSKYSKRRPKNKPPVRQGDVDAARYRPKTRLWPGNASSVPVEEAKSFDVGDVEYLDRYELGIFVDDERDIDKCEYVLPECDEWIVLRSYREVIEYLDSPTKRDTVFVSFDHYLSKRPGDPSGHDCMVAFMAERDEVANRLDIRGHSSDPFKNHEKLKYWYHDNAWEAPTFI